MSTLEHQQLGDYALHEEIGRGGMAVVYRATHPDFGAVAFKVLPPYFTHSTDVLRRFMNEARAVEVLRHPQIVQLYEAGDVRDPNDPRNRIYYIAMEYITGGSLLHRMRQTMPLALETVVRVGVEVGYALEYAHLKGFIHRDIKPSNILFQPDGQAVLADFGIARAVDQSRITRTGSITGTIAYMAPEIAQGLPAERHSDLYSLSLVLYEALTNTHPFGDDDSTPFIALQKIANTTLPPLTVAAPNVPPVLATVIERGLAKDPAHRHRSAGEFVLALQQARVGRVVSTSKLPTEPLPADQLPTHLLPTQTAQPVAGTIVDPASAPLTPPPVFIRPTVSSQHPARATHSKQTLGRQMQRSLESAQRHISLATILTIGLVILVAIALFVLLFSLSTSPAPSGSGAPFEQAGGVISLFFNGGEML